MAIERDLRGVYVPLVTPFAADGSVALDAIERMANRYLDAGVAGLVPLGTTGESPLLDAGEKRSVIEVVARVCTERHAQLIVGAGTNNTASTVAAVEALGEVAAVTHALVVSPYYLRPSQRGLLEHFRTVAGASPVPVVLYNIPSRTGVTIEADTMLELASVPNIAGVKQAVNGIDAATLRILAEAPPTFALLGGDDPYLLPTVLVGGTGAICASAHVCTERFVAMIECGLAGKVDEGRAHHEALLPVVQACFAEPNPAVFKGVLHRQGLIPTPDVRLPLVNASEAAVDRALAAIATASS
ncbi:MAG TPA: 4-hydroxy-tetrahydrodipicolinate synthase [Acidimicrobiia bacterium]|nr:4-hydroxy-tetrahydrodipicolinate synthase [Acidimicrobiia bacterium]